MRKLIVGFWCFLTLDLLISAVKSENCDVEIEKTLRALLSPRYPESIQLQSLRRQLVHKLQQSLEKLEEDEDPNLKRSLSALARWNNLPDKRNLEALARAGYIKTLPDIDDQQDSYKRSIANLAKNGQLPSGHEDKRGIQSLARSGEIHQKAHGSGDEMYKRNLASLARGYDFPSDDKRSISSLAKSGDLPAFYKRSIQALARDGDFIGKRNVAALLRQDSYLNEHNPDIGTENPDLDKRNLASIKAHYPSYILRRKRQAEYDDSLEYPAPVYQTSNVLDYEELLKYLTPQTDKRFLGRLPQMGKPKSTVSPKIRFH